MKVFDLISWISSHGPDKVGLDSALRASNASEVYEESEELVDNEILAIEYVAGKNLQ